MEQEMFFYATFVVLTSFFPLVFGVDMSPAMNLYKNVLRQQRKKINLLPPPWVFPIIWMGLWAIFRRQKARIKSLISSQLEAKGYTSTLK
jgi:tryptophan-rich sensory protein